MIEAAHIAGAAETTRPPLVSVVVNTLDRAEYLDRTLTGLRQLRYPDFEIVVVRGPCTDATDDILARHAAAIRVGHCAAPNLSMSRNIGIAMARGDHVAFIDDDAVPEPDWLDRLVPAFCEPSVGAAGGYIRNPDGVSFQYRVIVADRFGDASQKRALGRPPGPGRYLSPTGTNIAIRRSALLDIGGFDEHFVYFLDETDVNLRLADKGWRIAMVPEAEVHHKFARNQIRGADKAPKSMYPIARSKAYFAWRNADSDADTVTRHLSMYKKRRETVVRRALEKRMIDGEACERLIAEIARGLADGARAAAPEIPRTLLSSDLLRMHEAAAFKPSIRLGPAQPLRLCLLVPDELSSADDPLSPALRLVAEGLAQRGHEVTAICPAARGEPPFVNFVGGVWIHAMPRDRPRKAAVAREIARVQPRRAFQLVCGIVAKPSGGLSLRISNLSAVQGPQPGLWRAAGRRLLGGDARTHVRRLSRVLANLATGDGGAICDVDIPTGCAQLEPKIVDRLAACLDAIVRRAPDR